MIPVLNSPVFRIHRYEYDDKLLDGRSRDICMIVTPSHRIQCNRDTLKVGSTLGYPENIVVAVGMMQKLNLH